jgi:Na+/H+ antiporter NhaC
MLESYPWLSVLPPVIAIGIAISFRQVYLALIVGIWSGTTILQNGNVVRGLGDAIALCVDVFGDRGNTEIILFSALLGALVAYVQRSGGMHGFVELISRNNLVSNRRRAQLLTVALGSSMPVESNITVLLTGAVARPIFDKLKICREKLAYLCDSTAAPVCCLIPINAWGVYVAAVLMNQGVEQPFKVYISSLPLNFYPIFALLLVLFLVVTQKDFFSMARAEKRAREEGKVLRDGAVPMISDDVIEIEPVPGVPHRASNMLVPVITMMVVMVVAMIITGRGDITAGSGSTSVLWSVLAAIVAGGIKYRLSGIMSLPDLVNYFFKGVGGLIPIAVLMVFAFAIGQLCKDLNTGVYVAGIAQELMTPKLLPLVLFITTGFIAFSTGTSWGAWAIMFPIGIGIVHAMNIGMLPIVASILSGGVFGDHISPISDTTIVASMGSASDHMDHVNTQLPYALIAASASAVSFVILGVYVY